MPTRKRSKKPTLLKPQNPSNSLLKPENLKVGLFLVGVVLLFLIPIVGVVVIAGSILNHFRKK